MTGHPQITTILNAIAKGERDAANDLFPLVYDEVRQLAAAQMAKERSNHTLQATALANDAYLRLLGSENPKMADRRYFFAAVGQAMRRILIEHARRHRSRVQLATNADFIVGPTDRSPTPDWEAIDRALDQLGQEDERLAEVVHLRYFAGLSRAETAEALGVSEATVKRDWAYARARLAQSIGPSDSTE